jgi:hypothetical protein
MELPSFAAKEARAMEFKRIAWSGRGISDYEVLARVASCYRMPIKKMTKIINKYMRTALISLRYREAISLRGYVKLERRLLRALPTRAGRHPISRRRMILSSRPSAFRLVTKAKKKSHDVVNQRPAIPLANIAWRY